MKIGVITLYFRNYNFGGLLQGYALPTYLKKCGHECEQITFDRWIKQPLAQRVKNNDKRIGNLVVKCINKVVDKIISIQQKMLDKFYIGDKLCERQFNYIAFEKAIPHSERVYSVLDIEESNQVYDGFVCGSDVVWSGAIVPYVAALGFAKDEKNKLSYAASTSTKEVSDEWFHQYSQYLIRLDGVSVRERTIEESLRKRGIEAETLVDPTLLLTADDWNKVAVSPYEDEKYIFCYFLGDSMEYRKAVTKFAREKNLKIVTVPYSVNNMYRNCDKKFGDIQDVSSGPAEFLGLIRDAEYVITDSFHAIVFSLIYHTEFYVFPRINKSIDSSARLKNMLTEVALLDRMMSENCIRENEEIDFSKIDQIFEQKRELAKNYFIRCIK